MTTWLLTHARAGETAAKPPSTTRTSRRPGSQRRTYCSICAPSPHWSCPVVLRAASRANTAPWERATPTHAVPRHRDQQHHRPLLHRARRSAANSWACSSGDRSSPVLLGIAGSPRYAGIWQRPMYHRGTSLCQSPEVRFSMKARLTKARKVA
jgi:hypothetical protein